MFVSRYRCTGRTGDRYSPTMGGRESPLFRVGPDIMCRSTCRSCSVCESHSPFLVRTAERPACSSTKGTSTDYLRYRGARNVLGEVELRQRYTQVSVSYSLSVRGVSLGVKSASQREVLSNVPSSTSGQHSTATHSTAPSNADMFSRRLGKDGLLTRKFALWTSATVEARCPPA